MLSPTLNLVGLPFSFWVLVRQTHMRIRLLSLLMMKLNLYLSDSAMFHTMALK